MIFSKYLDRKIPQIVEYTLDYIVELHNTGTDEDKKECDKYATRVLEGMFYNNTELKEHYSKYYSRRLK